MARYHITIRAHDREALAPLTREHGVVPLHTAPADGGGYEVVSYAPEEKIRELEEHGYTVERHEDIDAGRDERLKEVSTEDAYAERLARVQQPPESGG